MPTQFYHGEAPSGSLSPRFQASRPAVSPSTSSPYLNAYDPRTSSSQSIGPSESGREGRRRLLLVYIHGFLGDETSFRSFPAHVHNLLTITLKESHVVHSKIYPKYRSRRPIEDAVNDFSKWLAPHENDNTDLILMAHSMGGLLASDVVLLPPPPPYSGRALRHKILGTVNFDVPFLGMHPGVISSGLSSIFRPGAAPQNKDQLVEGGDQNIPPYSGHVGFQASAGSLDGGATPPPKRVDTLFRKPEDSSFNPAFANDINLAIRKGWEGPMHFFKKHSDNLVRASREYVSSHLQFGWAMADYPKLRRRYLRIRALEEENQGVRDSATLDNSQPPRVRFLNYYTASTGRPKKPNSNQGESPYQHNVTSEGGSLSLAPSSTRNSTPGVSPRISVEEEHRREGIVPKELDMPPSLEDERNRTDPDTLTASDVVQEAARPAASDAPSAEPPDKVMELRPPPYSMEDPIEGAPSSLQQTQQDTAPEKQAPSQPPPASPSLSASLPPAPSPALSTSSASPRPSSELAIQPSNASTALTDTTTDTTTTMTKKKKTRYRKFCLVPSRDADGQRDRTWVPVVLRDVDEVMAHTGLFFFSESYEQLVGDVAARIEEWVGEEMTGRYLRHIGEGKGG